MLSKCQHSVQTGKNVYFHLSTPSSVSLVCCSLQLAAARARAAEAGQSLCFTTPAGLGCALQVTGGAWVCSASRHATS